MRSILETAHRTKWPTVVVLAGLLAATALGWYWVWGVLFLYWAVAGIVSGEAFVVQTVRRDEHRVLFSLISLSWLVLAGLMVLYAVLTSRLPGLPQHPEHRPRRAPDLPGHLLHGQPRGVRLQDAAVSHL